MRTFLAILVSWAVAVLPIASANPLVFLSGNAPTAGGGGTPAFVQDDGAQNDPFNGARSVTFTSSTVSGNAIAAIYFGTNAASLVVTDDKGNTYALAEDGATSGCAIAVCPNITGGASHQVTFTVTSHSNPGYMIIMEISGVATSSPTDDTDEETGFVSNSSIDLTTTVNNTFLIGALFSGTPDATAGAGFTLRHAQGGLQTETKVGATSGTNTVNFSHSERGAQISAIALKPQ